MGPHFVLRGVLFFSIPLPPPKDAQRTEEEEEEGEEENKLRMARNITHAFLFLSAFYVNWAQTRNFSLGDKLVFPFRSGVYNIMEVSEEDFYNCTQKNVSNWYPKGPTIIELTEPGKHYYYCGVGRHCEAGQKLSIDVSATPA